MGEKKEIITEVSIVAIVAFCLGSLVFAGPSPETAETLTQILWAGMVGLGLYKATPGTK